MSSDKGAEIAIHRPGRWGDSSHDFFDIIAKLKRDEIVDPREEAVYGKEKVKI